MKVTTNKVTAYSKSPVIEIKEDGHLLKVALDFKGEIYRKLEYSETPTECEPFEVNISDNTHELIEDWRKHKGYATACKIEKLDAIQQYEIMINYGSIDSSPLHSLNINLYYPAIAAVDKEKKIIEYRKERNIYLCQISSLKQQVTVLQAKLKVPAKMAEKNCTDKQALAYVLGGKSYDSYLSVLFDKKIIHPNSYTGSGKYCSKGSDKAAAIAQILAIAGIKYTTGNDAPKGGFTGEFIKIK